MTDAELAIWLYRYRTNLDHQSKLRAIRENGEREVQKIRRDYAHLRRRREAVTAGFIKSAFRLEHLSSDEGMPYSVAERYHTLRVEQSGSVASDEQPFVAGWTAHVETAARTMGVTIEWVPECAGLNSYAWASLRRIEIAPIYSGGLYAVALHELAHVALPCDDTHRRSNTEDGSCCVRCEIIAWRWAIQHATPAWTRQMHRRLSRSLTTYRSYGTPEEQAELDHLTSDVGLFRALLARIS